MDKIETLQDCIEGLEGLIKGIDLSDIYLDDVSHLNKYAGYNEEDRVKDIILYLKNVRKANN